MSSMRIETSKELLVDLAVAFQEADRLAPDELQLWKACLMFPLSPFPSIAQLMAAAALDQLTDHFGPASMS